MITNYLNTDWHGVPAGTALTIIERVVQVNGGNCFRVSRADGLDLPGPFETTTSVALVGEEFVSVSASYDPLPDGTPDWMRRSISENRERLPQRAYIIDGVIFWRSNDRPVPATFFAENFVSLPPAQREADTAHQKAAIEAYRQSRANLSPEQQAEEAYERRAAFGPGQTVVDILTGETHRT